MLKNIFTIAAISGLSLHASAQDNSKTISQASNHTTQKVTETIGRDEISFNYASYTDENTGIQEIDSLFGEWQNFKIETARVESQLQWEKIRVAEDRIKLKLKLVKKIITNPTKEEKEEYENIVAAHKMTVVKYEDLSEKLDKARDIFKAVEKGEDDYFNSGKVKKEEKMETITKLDRLKDDLVAIDPQS